MALIKFTICSNVNLSAVDSILSLCDYIAFQTAAKTFSISMTADELKQWLLQEIPQPEHVANIEVLLSMLIRLIKHQ